MLDLLIRDEKLIPAVDERFGAFHARLDDALDVLLRDRRLGEHTSTGVAALIRLALNFESWRALCRESGLEERAAAELVARLVATAS